MERKKLAKLLDYAQIRSLRMILSDFTYKEIVEAFNDESINVSEKIRLFRLISKKPVKFLVSGLPSKFTEKDVVQSATQCGFLTFSNGDGVDYIKVLRLKYEEKLYSSSSVGMKNRTRVRYTAILDALKKCSIL